MDKICKTSKVTDKIISVTFHRTIIHACKHNYQSE